LAWDLLRADGGITCRMPFKGAFPPRLEGRHDSRLAAPFLPSRILRPNTASAGLTGQTDRGSDRLAAGAPFAHSGAWSKVRKYVSCNTPLKPLYVPRRASLH
jgi:hypothetical protein